MNPEEKQLLDNGYKKTIYSFSPEEARQISQLETIVNIGSIAQKMIDTVIFSQILPRFSIKESRDNKVTYDSMKNIFTVYSPKVWCMLCGIRKADFTYQAKLYCQSCVDKLKAVEAPKKVEKKKKAKV